MVEKVIFDALSEDPYFEHISKQWSDALRRGLQNLPKPTDDYWL